VKNASRCSHRLRHPARRAEGPAAPAAVERRLKLQERIQRAGKKRSGCG
jgi:hypothetical protein